MINVASAGLPTNFGAQPLLDVRRSFSLLNSLQIQFSVITFGRRIVGDVFELDRFFRKPVFEGRRVLNMRALLNHWMPLSAR